MYKLRLFALLLLAFGLCTLARAQDAVFIVNKATKVDSLSADDARAILLGNKVRFEDGTVIRLAVQTDGAVHESIIRTYVQRSTDQFEKFWKRLVFTGKGVMPEECGSDAEVIAYVAKTPGAFGYVAKASVTPDVAVVQVR